MHVERYCIILIFLLFYTNIARSQKQRTEISINFRTNSIVIDSTYSDNAARMRGIITTLQNIKQDSTVNIVEVSFWGQPPRKVVTSLTANWHEDVSRLSKNLYAEISTYPTASSPETTAIFLGTT